MSVVVPTKDRPALLQRALNAALAQQGCAAEIIVADDGRGDGLAVVAALHAPHVSAFSTEARGQAAARNLAVARAKAPHIAFLDDDDWWAAPDHLARLAATLAGGADLAYAAGRIVHEERGDAEVAFDPSIDAAAIRRDNLLLVSGIGYARALHTRVGPFDESFAVYWDWDFYLRLAAAGARFSASGSDGVRISVRSGTASSGAERARRQSELDRLAAKHGLGPLTLRNHASIAADQAAARAGGQAAPPPAVWSHAAPHALASSRTRKM